MVNKTDKDNGFPKRKEFKRDEPEIKHQIENSKELANDWQKTPEWAVNYKTPAAPVSELISLAKKIERLYKIREKSLGDELSRSGEPVWKILIQIVIATEEKKHISLADISDLISLPHTITNRYLNILENKGFIAWERDPSGQHGDQLHLTTKGQSIMRKTLLALDTI